MGKTLKVNFKGLQRFQKQLESLQDNQVEQFIEGCAKELAARLLAKVIKRTPVGENTVETIIDENGNARQQTIKGGGTLRRGWTAETEAEARNGGSSDVIDYVNSLNIRKNGDSFIIDIINPVHYASYVEYGHRQEPGRYVPAIGKKLKNAWVEGKFMLTISEQEIEADAPKVLENKLKKYMGEQFR